MNFFDICEISLFSHDRFLPKNGHESNVNLTKFRNTNFVPIKSVSFLTFRLNMENLTVVVVFLIFFRENTHKRSLFFHNKTRKNVAAIILA